MNDDFINYIDVDPKDLLVTGQVEVGDSATGVIDFEKDNDWFKVELKGGHTYVIDMEGSATDMGTLSDPIIHGIFDSSGQRVVWTFNDDGGEGYNARLTFTPEQSGLYFISASSYGFPYGDRPTPYELGSYTISVVDTTPDAVVYTPVSSDPISAGGSLSSSGSSNSSSSSTSASTGNNSGNNDEDGTTIDFNDYNHIEGTGVIEGTPADDYIVGSNGDDVITALGGDDFVIGLQGVNTLNGGPGNDELFGGNSKDTINGGRGNDIILGGGGADLLYGDAGNDKIYAASGDDKLYGGSGNDHLQGEQGSDELIPGTGRDTLQGGSGKDIFVFGRNDGHNTIFDFNATSRFGGAKDKIEFSEPGLTFDDLRITPIYRTDSDGYTIFTGTIKIIAAGTTIILEDQLFVADLDASDFNFIV